MSEHIARVVQKATRRRGPYGGLHYYAECSCGYRGGPRDDHASAERDGSAHEQRERQAEFVKAWRAEHYDEVYTTPVLCPLCNFALQSNAGGNYRLVEDHTDEHGQDYRDYMAAGQEPQ